MLEYNEFRYFNISVYSVQRGFGLIGEDSCTYYYSCVAIYCAIDPKHELPPLLYEYKSVHPRERVGIIS